jgi:looped-hinge helix DNA binding domain, AbrB family
MASWARKLGNIKQAAVKIDNKGRVTLPKNIREALGLETGDTVFLKYEPEKKAGAAGPSFKPFDVLAEHAIKDTETGAPGQ